MKFHPFSRLFNFLVVFALAMIVASCAGLMPEKPGERLAAGYQLAKTIDQTADQLYMSKQINKANAANIFKTTGVALEGLDVVKDMQLNGMPGADAKLTATIAILTALQAQLAKQQAAIPSPIVPASGVK